MHVVGQVGLCDIRPGGRGGLLLKPQPQGGSQTWPPLGSEGEGQELEGDLVRVGGLRLDPRDPVRHDNS